MFRRQHRISIGTTESSRSLLAESESGECIPSKATGNVSSSDSDPIENNNEAIIDLNDVKQDSESKAINWLFNLDQSFDDHNPATRNSGNIQSLDNFSLLRRTSNRCLLQWKPNRTNDSTPPGFNSRTHIFRNFFNTEEKHKTRKELGSCSRGDAAAAANVLETAEQGKDPIVDEDACDNMMGRKRKLCPFSFRRALKSALFASSIPLPPHNRREWPYLKFRREPAEPQVDKAILISSGSSNSSSSSETLFSRVQKSATLVQIQ